MPGPQPPSQITVHSQTIVLTDAEFKALPTTAIEIIPAQGTGTIIRWLGAWMVLDSSAGAYSVVGVPILQLVYLTSPSPLEASGFVNLLGTLPVMGVFSSPFPALASYDAGEGYLTWSPTDTGTAIQNTGLGVADVYNGVSDYAGGNSANTLQVNVLYTVVEA